MKEEAVLYYERSYHGKRWHIVTTPEPKEEPALCRAIVVAMTRVSSDHYSDGTPLAICTHCRRRALDTHAANTGPF